MTTNFAIFALIAYVVALALILVFGSIYLLYKAIKHRKYLINSICSFFRNPKYLIISFFVIVLVSLNIYIPTIFPKDLMHNPEFIKFGNLTEYVMKFLLAFGFVALLLGYPERMAKSGRMLYLFFGILLLAFGVFGNVMGSVYQANGYHVTRNFDMLTILSMYLSINLIFNGKIKKIDTAKS